jgi:hypothetical protein
VLRTLCLAALLLLPAVARADATGEIDWTRRVIKARGQGAPDLNAPSISVARLGAERAAKADAFRNLLETLKGATVSQGDSIGTLMQNDSTLKTKVEGTIRGFKVVAPHYYSDGGVSLDVELDLDKLPAELAALLKPPAGTAAPKEAAKPAEKAPSPKSDAPKADQQ